MCPRHLVRLLQSSAVPPLTLAMQIDIYTRGNCQYCAAARRLLEKRGVRYTETDLDGTSERARMIAKRTGQTTTPLVFVDGTHIGGFDELVELDQEGKLG